MFFGSSTPPEPLGRFSGFLLNWVGIRAREAFAHRLAAHGLRPPHFTTMLVIDGSPGLAQQELVAATDIDPSTMVALIDDLEGAGLAERRPHASDRRKRSVHLTPAGEEKLQAVLGGGDVLEGEAFGALDPGERAELHRLLRKLAGYTD